jgi:hypothetical protein
MASLIPVVAKAIPAAVSIGEIGAGIIASFLGIAGASGSYDEYLAKKKGSGTITTDKYGTKWIVYDDGSIKAVPTVATAADSAGGGGRIIDWGTIQPIGFKDDSLGAAIKEAQKAIGKLLGSTSSSIIKYKYRAGQTSNTGVFKDALTLFRLFHPTKLKEKHYLMPFVD